jgi:hypothetical protein
LGIHWAGWARVAPGLIDADGIMGSFAFDSYEYQSGATQLAAVLREGGVTAWAAQPQPVHVRLLSLQFALLGPLFGYGTLSAEPFNLLCYLAVIALTLLLGREVGGPRAGLLAAGAVALWPTLLLHTLQLLKDPLFIAGALALVLCVTTWLTRTYGRSGAGGAVALMGITTLLLMLIRPKFVAVVFALVLVGAALLAARQIVERRRLYWNMVAPCVMLAAGALLLLQVLLVWSPPGQRFKHYPSDGGGRPKTAVSDGGRVATVVNYFPRATNGGGGEAEGRVGQLAAAADNAAHRIGIVRYRFNAGYTDAGSGVDHDVRFSDLKSLVLYVPRAFIIGFWGPLPKLLGVFRQARGERGEVVVRRRNFLHVSGRAAGARGRPPAPAEARLVAAVGGDGVRGDGAGARRAQHRRALQIPVHVLGAVARARGQGPRQPPRVARAACQSGQDRRGRLGARARLRVYSDRGLEGGRRESNGRRASVVTLACVLTIACACAPNAGPGGAAPNAPDAGTPATVAETGDARVGPSDITLTNLTGANLRAVYLSPNSSGGWEENVLGEGGLGDGHSVNIRFSPEEKAAAWDIRIEGGDEHSAEWKGVRLGGVSRITLYLDVVGERVVVAEVE